MRLHPGVQLRGDWAAPESNNGMVLGTILEVRVGKNAPNYDGSVKSWWNDSQAGNALRTTYTSIADRFIEMNAGTGVTNPGKLCNDRACYSRKFLQRFQFCAK